jgi:hypothetical protein
LSTRGNRAAADLIGAIWLIQQDADDVPSGEIVSLLNPCAPLASHLPWLTAYDISRPNPNSSRRNRSSAPVLLLVLRAVVVCKALEPACAGIFR